MCYAGNCHPECDNCMPKYVYCAECGNRVLIGLKACPSCKHVITESERDKAREEWKARHPHSATY